MALSGNIGVFFRKGGLERGNYAGLIEKSEDFIEEGREHINKTMPRK